MAAFRFCPACGEALPAADSETLVSRQDCPSCGAVHYKNAKPCAGALVVREGKVLLGLRAIEPFKGYWDIPGGFLEPWEHPAEAAAREVAEETGLEVHLTELFDIVVDTYGESGDFTLNIFYLAEVTGGSPRPADDLVEIGWFAPDALPEKIAFANGRKVLDTWRRTFG